MDTALGLWLIGFGCGVLFSVAANFVYEGFRAKHRRS